MIAKKFLPCLARCVIAFWTLASAQSFAADCCSNKKSQQVTADTHKGLKIELISSVDSIKPGGTFEVGLHIKHDQKLFPLNRLFPQYHTYWINPGVVGIPTEIKWKLPEGFTASKVQWPYPELSMMADIPCYGYERDVVLLYTITAPAKLSKKEVTLIGDASWMCCATYCYPGYSKLTLSIPVGDGTPKKSTTALFAQARKEIPQASKAIKASLLSAPDASLIKVLLSSDKPFTPIHVFNSDKQATPDQTSTIEIQPDGSWLYQTTRSRVSPKNAKEFPMVLQTKRGFVSLTAKPIENQ